MMLQAHVFAVSLGLSQASVQRAFPADGVMVAYTWTVTHAEGTYTFASLMVLCGPHTQV